MSGVLGTLRGVLLEGLAQAIKPELLLLAVYRLGHPVGVEDDGVARRQLVRVLVVVESRQHAQGDSLGHGQLVGGPVGVYDERGIMATVRVGQFSGCRVVHRVDHGDEHAGVVVLVEHVVHLGEGLAGAVGPHGRALQQRAARHHEECRRDALARNVGNGESYSAISKSDDIEEVAADIASRLHGSEQFVVVIPGELVRKNGLLHHARDIEFVLQHNEFVSCAQSVLPFTYVLQCAIDCELEIVEVDRLGDEVEGTTVHSDPDVLHVAVCGDDHGANVRCHVRDSLEERKPIHLRHVYV